MLLDRLLRWCRSRLSSRQRRRRKREEGEEEEVVVVEEGVEEWEEEWEEGVEEEVEEEEEEERILSQQEEGERDVHETRSRAENSMNSCSTAQLTDSTPSRSTSARS